jgi:putative two-component system response regulator
MKKRILFVDDERHVLDALRRMLRCQRNEWDITCIEDSLAAWNLLQRSEFDAVVSDIRMPRLDGLELLSRIQQTEHTRDVPVVILTGLTARELKRQALELGATDLLNKPVEPEDLVARLRSVLRLKAIQDELKAHNELLEQRVQEKTCQLYQARLDIIWRLGKAAEHRDDLTGNHVIRVGCYCRVLAEALGMDSEFVENIFLAAPLHDIGKIGIPDAILFKPANLTGDERKVMQRHCEIGARILREGCKAKDTFLEWHGLADRLVSDSANNAALEMGAAIALSHHEKWDGSGYPRGLSGDDIPVESQIVAIADVFDAMTTARPYKKAYGESEALQIIRHGANCHFAPAVYSVFLETLPQIRTLRKRFADPSDYCGRWEEMEYEADIVCR